MYHKIALFNETAAPMIQSFLKGYNVTVIAYGQTGSGKTFTMGSASAPDDESIEDTVLHKNKHILKFKPFI